MTMAQTVNERKPPPLRVTSAETEPEETQVPGFQVKTIQVSDSVDPQAAKDGETSVTFLEDADGIWLKDAPLNEVFQYIAQKESLQFFHNPNLAGPQFLVTGQLIDHYDPIKQMEELGLMYGVSVHRKGNTVYALTSAQEDVLPGKPMHYKLRYLRSGDIEAIKAMLEPFLTPGTGIVEYESKTNTIVIFDNERRAEQLLELLDKLDTPKQQVAIETRILRVKSSSRNRVGVDWTSILGEGISWTAVGNLNSLFNLPNLDVVDRVIKNDRNGPDTVTSTRTQNSNENFLVLSPTQMNAVMRALNQGGLAQQESSPTLITEDNEEGLISIIDRVPIIVNTISETQVGQNISEEVRYKVDPEDPQGDPATSREIGVSVAVTPTILPDRTIRMKLRPRSAQIVEFIESRSGNIFPRVNESTVTTLARVPDGHSLLIGGFYEEVETENDSKVPLVGDVPGINFFFKSDDKAKEHTSLVFVVTPKMYFPNDPCTSDRISGELEEIHVLPNDHDYPDRERPDYNYKRNMKDTLSGIFKKRPADPPSSPLVPWSPPSVEVDNPALHLRTRSIRCPFGGGKTGWFPRTKNGKLFQRLFKRPH